MVILLHSIPSAMKSQTKKTLAREILILLSVLATCIVIAGVFFTVIYFINQKENDYKSQLYDYDITIEGSRAKLQEGLALQLQTGDYTFEALHIIADEDSALVKLDENGALNFACLIKNILRPSFQDSLCVAINEVKLKEGKTIDYRTYVGLSSEPLQQS